MPQIPVPVATIGLLLMSNVFMTFAWYGHLKFKAAPLMVVILVSWGIAFFEYLLQVPANRIGHRHFSAAELKTIQEVITLSVFVVLSVLVIGATFGATVSVAGDVVSKAPHPAAKIGGTIAKLAGPVIGAGTYGVCMTVSK
jgi:uncharacterized protein (DUF486 family)